MSSTMLPGFNNNSILAMAHTSSPYVSVYKFNDVTGYGTKYSNPTILPAGEGKSVTFSPNLSAIAVGEGNIEVIAAYAWNSSTGFGTRYSNPGTLSYDYGYKVAFNPAGDVLAIATSSSPYVYAYAWSAGFGTKYSNPSPALPGHTGYSVAFNPDGTVIMMLSGSSPYINAYAWSGGFSTKYSNPATLPSNGSGAALEFSPSGNAVLMSAVGGSVYAWSGGFGTKYSNPASFPYLTQGGAWHPSGNVIAFAGVDRFGLTTNSDLHIYDWNSSTGFGTKYSYFAYVSMKATSLSWNSTGTAISYGSSTDAPYINTYAWYNGLQSRYSNPTTSVPGPVNEISFR
jgi:hypothetical protein